MLWFDGSESPITGETVLDSCVVTAGHSTNPSFGYAGGIINWYDSSPKIKHIQFRYNIGINAGAMLNDYGSPIVSNCSFFRNVAIGNGGGMFNVYGAAPYVANCEFVENISGHVGGGVDQRSDTSNPATFVNCLFLRNRAKDQGGGMRAAVDSKSQLVSCTFVGNIVGPPSDGYLAPVGGGGFSLGGDGSMTTPRTSELHNCIFFDNELGEDADGGPDISITGRYAGNLTVSFSNVPGGESAVFISTTCPPCCAPECTPAPGCNNNCPTLLTWGDGNMDVDPLFVDADDDNFRLQYISPCLKNGDETLRPEDVANLDGDNSETEPVPLDLDNLPRVDLSDCLDLGAYQNQVAATCPGDITGPSGVPDGTVGIADLLRVIATWSTPGGAADVAPAPCGDGVVDIGDLLEVISAWGTCMMPGQMPESLDDCYDLADETCEESEDPDCWYRIYSGCVDYLCQEDIITCN